MVLLMGLHMLCFPCPLHAEEFNASRYTALIRRVCYGGIKEQNALLCMEQWLRCHIPWLQLDRNQEHWLCAALTCPPGEGAGARGAGCTRGCRPESGLPRARSCTCSAWPCPGLRGHMAIADGSSPQTGISTWLCWAGACARSAQGLQPSSLFEQESKFPNRQCPVLPTLPLTAFPP